MDYKRLGIWIRIIFYSVFLVIMGFSFIFSMFSSIEVNGNFQNDITSYIFILPVVYFIWALRKGIKQLKQLNPTLKPEYIGELNIRFESKIDFKSYRNFIFGSIFKNPKIIVFLVIGLIVAFSGLFQSTQNFSFQNGSVFIFPIIVILIPLIFFFMVRKEYDSAKLFHEKVEYSITKEGITMKSESMDSLLRWPMIQKVNESKFFYLLYTSSSVSIFIDKRKLTLSELGQFSEFIGSLNIPRV